MAAARLLSETKQASEGAWRQYLASLQDQQTFKHNRKIT